MNIQKTKHAKVDFNCLCFLWKTKQKSRELRFENKLPFFQLSLRCSIPPNYSRGADVFHIMTYFLSK